MSVDPYSAAVRQLFASPAHAGVIEGGVSARVDDQGVRIELSATRSDGILGEVRFRAWGCPHLIAAAERACSLCEGQAPTALEDFRIAPIMENLAIPTEKTGRILVLEDTVRSLGHKFRDGT